MNKHDPSVNANANLRGLIATITRIRQHRCVWTEKFKLCEEAGYRRIGRKRKAIPKHATPPAQQAKKPRNLTCVRRCMRLISVELTVPTSVTNQRSTQAKVVIPPTDNAKYASSS